MSSLLEVPLARRLHRLPVVRLLHGRAAQRAWSWDLRDQLTREWWPQGITWAGERLLVSWYSRRGAGSRVSVVDLATRRYAHVPLLTPEGEPLRVHAGGLAWGDGWLYVAATARGFWTLHVDDLVVGRECTWRARAIHRPTLPGSDEPFRWSFLDLAPLRWSSSEERQRREGVETTTPSPVEVRASRPLLAGEYGRGTKTTRLARLTIIDGQPRGDLEPLGAGPSGMQGVTTYADGLVVSTSAGPWRRGGLRVLTGRSTPHAADVRWAAAPAASTGATAGARTAADGRDVRPPPSPGRLVGPVGVEDVTRDPLGRLWTVGEHPARRSIVRLNG